MLTDSPMEQLKKPIATEQQIVSLGKVLQKLRDEDDIDALMQTIISYLKEQFDYQLIWIALYEHKNHKLIGKGGIVPSSDKSLLRQNVTLNPGDLLEKVVIAQSPLGVADLRKEGRIGNWQVVATKFGIQGTVFLPIRYRNYCVGVLLLGSQRWGYLLTGDARERLLIVIDELGASLYRQQAAVQQKQIKQSEEPLVQLIENIRRINKLDEKLESIVHTTQKYISADRTSIYWFERQGRYFWCRMNSQNLAHNPIQHKTDPKATGITVQDLNDFYYTLSVDQIVWIGEGRSSLNSHVTEKLLQRMKIRSLLAAPIICQKDIVGFLAVENLQARIWTQGDKNFIQSCAGLISLVAPTENMESSIKEIEQDNEIINHVARAIHHKQEIKQVLQISGGKILERIAGSRFIILLLHPSYHNFQIFYQINSSTSSSRRLLRSSLTSLQELDAELLRTATQAVSIEDIEDDLRFFNWRDALLENNIRSLLICNCAQGNKPELLLVVTDENYRAWTDREKDFLGIVSQYFGLIVKNGLLESSNLEQQKISQTFQQYFNVLLQSDSSTSEGVALQQIASVLNCPLAILLSWSSGKDLAKIIPLLITDHRFAINTDLPLVIQKEPLLQWALSRDTYSNFQVESLLPETRKWLTLPENGQVFVMALKTSADYPATNVVLLANDGEQIWSEITLRAAANLVYQLALWQRKQRISQRLESTTDKLQQLNWYKHGRLEEIHRMSSLVVRQIQDLGIPTNDLTQTRYRLLLRQLDFITKSMSVMLNQEQWKLHINHRETMLISSLLKRSRERVDNLINQRQIWIGVHGLRETLEEWESLQKSSNGEKDQKHNPAIMAIAGDIMKIELVIHELLVAACNRSPNGDRIDIWCRRLAENSLELSIMDNGTIEPQLLVELDPHTKKNVFAASSSLSKPPGLHLLICQKLMGQLGGELQIYKVPDDHRVISRLVLPLATSNPEH